VNEDLAFLGGGYLVVNQATRKTHELLLDSIDLKDPHFAGIAAGALHASRIPETLELMLRIQSRWANARERKEIESLISLCSMDYKNSLSNIAKAQAGQSHAPGGIERAQELLEEAQFCENLLAALYGPTYKADVAAAVLNLDLAEKVVHLKESCQTLFKRQIEVKGSWERAFTEAWLRWYESAPWKNYDDREYVIRFIKSDMVQWYAYKYWERPSFNAPLSKRLPGFPFEIPKYVIENVDQKLLSAFVPIHSALATELKHCEECFLGVVSS
jgi:hypothetical protein